MMRPTLFAVELLVLCLSAISYGAQLPESLTEESQACVKCHRDAKNATFAIYGQWKNGRHYEVDVGCFECHKAEKEDKDAYLHEGYTISLIVSPKDCEPCHPEQVEQFSQSRHSTTYVDHMESQSSELTQTFISDVDFVSPSFPSQHALTAGVTGCLQCHGTRVKVQKMSDEEIALDAATWPNEGVGRVNPDGSLGACSSCHARHEFSIAQARRPESCGKCHTWGSGIPMFDIYKASNHGRSYYTNEENMGLDSPKWVMGEQYVTGPTCASCHMSETPNMPPTHNASLRFNWGELGERAVNSQYHPPSPGPYACGLPPGRTSPENPVEPRPVDEAQTMQGVCGNCHSDHLIDGYFIQNMAVRRLVHEKYTIPGTRLYNIAKQVLNALEDGKYAFFTHPIDFIWFEACSHDAAHAIAAVAKASGDYTYTSSRRLAERWFKDFVPELRRIVEEGQSSTDRTAREAAQKLELELEKTLSDPIYGSGWASKFGCVSDCSDN